MANQNIIQDFKKAFESGDASKMRGLLADNFTFDHKNHEDTNGKEDFVKMVESIRKAFPDLRFNMRNINEQGDRVTAEVRLEGTQKGPLDLSAMGMQTVNPTNKELDMSWEKGTWRIENQKIVEHTVEKSDRGGLPGMLQSLGVQVERHA